MSLIKALAKRAALTVPPVRQVFTERDLLQTERDQLRSALANSASDLADVQCRLQQAESALAKAATSPLVPELEKTSKAPAPFFTAPKHITTTDPTPSIYVLSAWSFNHQSRNVGFDTRLISSKPYAFYFFDGSLDLENFPSRYLKESDIFPLIAGAGRRHLAEWAFFLMEYHNNVLNYPFYTISSRFYEKNLRLAGSLDDYWGRIFGGLERYGYGYLPAYDRDFDFLDMLDYFAKGRLGMTTGGFEFIKQQFGVDMRSDYRYVSDYWCNYIGFKSRSHFERYMDFYMPVFDKIFDADFNLKWDYGAHGIVRSNVAFRELKPLTLLLEQMSHLFFFKEQVPFYGLHYDADYEVREWERRGIKLGT